LNQAPEAFRDVRLFDFQESSFNQVKCTALTNLAGHVPYIAVGFFATTAMTDDEHPAPHFIYHAATPDTAFSSSVQ
jgi:hypothetical protein